MLKRPNSSVRAEARTHMFIFSLHVLLVRIQTSSPPVGSTEGGLDAVRAMQTDCAALTGLLSSSFPTQGFGRFAASTLGVDAPRFQRFPSS